jgi:hypothetical protein
MRTKNTKLKRSYECILKSGTRTIKFRNDDVGDEYPDQYRWAQKVLTGFHGIFGEDWELIGTVNRKAKQ